MHIFQETELNCMLPVALETIFELLVYSHITQLWWGYLGLMDQDDSLTFQSVAKMS